MKRTFSESALMERMTPGIVYPARKVASWFGIEPHEAKGHLEALWHRGLLRRRQHSGESWGFQRPALNAVEPIEHDMSVAAPQMPPDMTSTMTGYEREMRRHVALCMSIRRFA